MKRALIVFASALIVAAPAMADEAMAKANNCMACHAVDKKLVGPSYKDVAKKHGNDASKADMLAAKIIKGGSGVYGAIPMPANPKVSEADAKKLATWVLSFKCFMYAVLFTRGGMYTTKTPPTVSSWRGFYFTSGHEPE